MADITIHDLTPETEAALKALAARKGVSVEDVAREALDEIAGRDVAGKDDRAALLARIDRIRAMTPPGPQTDSGEILSQIRQERSDRLAAPTTPLIVDAAG